MEDIRELILKTGLTILREEGLSSFTQPRIAARSGLRHSHLTYYFPTRTALLAAVVREAIDMQMAAVRSMAETITSPQQAVAAVASVVAQHENTRVFVALNQAADREASLRELFNELTENFVGELTKILEKFGMKSDQASVDLVRSLLVGLSVLNLIGSHERGEARAKAVMKTAFDLLSSN
ncbi:AcrR family transcriptional regulator [Bradyrhizobium elkanii]|uniref:TetR/AcrR family transcriptional regulator n=1 Tax=Bradyrhizobium elkanii TaxID=29448 RepID=UPI0022268983|nr:TetR/AcrR family transcriptional regulator [Bradyrhizobium elkanii]MCW2205593.1 AcrR family transcriptional regulator [Bradyrhizobium elkanii]